MQRSVKEIPTFIKAKSPEGLRRLMLRNNVNMSAPQSYFDINFVNGNWYAWFYREQNIDLKKPIEELVEKGE